MRLRIAFAIVALMWGGLAMCAQEMETQIELPGDPAPIADFVGFGAQWNAGGYVAFDVTDDEFQVLADRVRWMRLPMARVMVLSRWCYFDDEGYNWDTPEMQALYRLLDVCEELGTTVLLTDWGGEKEWTTAPGIEGVDDPLYAEVIGTYLDHLINEKGYSCIEYFIVTNEPNWEVGDFDRWKTGFLNVVNELRQRGLDEQVELVGSGTSQQVRLTPAEDGTFDIEPWHVKAVEQLHEHIEMYSIHRYAERDRVREGSFEDFWRAQWDYSREHDPEGATKLHVVGEAGMNDDAQHPYGSPYINDYGYGVFMAEYAVQAARAGSDGVSAWMLDDNSHPGFFWGLWSNKEEGMELRPWFYTWALLSRYFPGGATVYMPEQPQDIRLLAAETDDGWTICLINRRDAAATVTLQLPSEAAGTFREYRYAEDQQATDDQGFPVPVGEHDTEGALTVEIPSEAVVVLTSLM